MVGICILRDDEEEGMGGLLRGLGGTVWED